MSDQDQYLHDTTRITAAARALHEHFDNVMIFASRTTTDGEVDHWELGLGNSYASYGQVMMWTRSVDQVFRDAASGTIRDALNDEPEEF